jgi:hypothetical protein
MARITTITAESPPTPDRLTLIAISTLAYIAAVGLHEHLGHTTACILLGSHPIEVGAFYVNCDYSGLSDLRIQLVTLAGPLVSLLIGIISFLGLRLRPPRSNSAFYFVWLLGTVGLMAATGYLLFSGVSGIGDFGSTRDGAFYQATPEWFWRLVLTLAGMASYYLVIYISVRMIDPHIAGEGRTRIRFASLLALMSYLTGAMVSILTGLLNPHGLIIVLISSAASSLGATSGLLWMMQLLDRKRVIPPPGLVFQRSWVWIGLGVVVTTVYALVLGPTIRP